MSKSALVYVAMIITAGAGSAQPAAPAPTEAIAPKAAAGSTLVCRADTALGSRVVRRKICKTASDWEADRRETRNIIDQGQSQQLTRSH